MNEEEKRTKIERILQDEACDMCVCSYDNDYSAAYLDAEVDMDHVKQVTTEIINVFAKGESEETDQVKKVAADVIRIFTKGEGERKDRVTAAMKIINQFAEEERVRKKNDGHRISEEPVRSVKEIKNEIERMQNVLKHMNPTQTAHDSPSLNYMFGKISGMYFTIGKRTNAKGEVIEDE